MVSIENGRVVQVTVVGLYVDDMVVTCSSEEQQLSIFAQQMKEKYQSIQVHVGKVLPFLGMLLDFSVVGSVRLSMQPYIEDILDECIDIYNSSGDRDNRAHSTPASIGLFDIDNDSPPLDEEGKTRFHTAVAKLLYLAKKVRPDILTAVSFLSTRVQRPTTQDNKKLVRVLKYIKGTKNLGIVISPSKKIAVDAYIDASFAVHADAKSQACISLWAKVLYSIDQQSRR
jgi:hypothetical protein